MTDVLPSALEAQITAQGDEACLALAADLSSDGMFAEEWVVATRRNLLVFDRDGQSRISLPLDKIRRAAVDVLVGGGSLVVTVDRQSVEFHRLVTL